MYFQVFSILLVRKTVHDHFWLDFDQNERSRCGPFPIRPVNSFWCSERPLQNPGGSFNEKNFNSMIIWLKFPGKSMCSNFTVYNFVWIWGTRTPCQRTYLKFKLHFFEIKHAHNWTDPLRSDMLKWYVGVLKWGYPKIIKFIFGSSTINHPAICVPPFMETFICCATPSLRLLWLFARKIFGRPSATGLRWSCPADLHCCS